MGKGDDQPPFVRAYRQRIILANKEALASGAEPIDLFRMMVASLAEMLVQHSAPGKEVEMTGLAKDLMNDYFDKVIRDQDMRRTE